MPRVNGLEFSFPAENTIYAVHRVNFDDAVFLRELFHLAVLSKAKVAVDQHDVFFEAPLVFFENSPKVLLNLGIVYVEVLADEDQINVQVSFLHELLNFLLQNAARNQADTCSLVGRFGFSSG